MIVKDELEKQRITWVEFLERNGFEKIDDNSRDIIEYSSRNISQATAELPQISPETTKRNKKSRHKGKEKVNEGVVESTVPTKMTISKSKEMK